MKTIRILLYTDIEVFEIPGDTLSISDAQRFIQLKLKNIARVVFTIRNRHFDYLNNVKATAATKLTADLLSQHDELWVFCFGNEDTKKNPGHGLDKEEADNLFEWMKRGGVMVTGDHSQPEGERDCAEGKNHADFFALGSPIGHGIPRARDLRVWKGPPTNCIVAPSQLENSDTRNTLEEGPCTPGLLDGCLQRDPIAQNLVRVPPRPHFLFCYDLDANRQPIPITKLPDHQHEGRVLIPETYDDCWPARPPAPEFVAFGRDKRFTVNERVYPLVVAYDGDDAAVGRIVADTSFHHFLNLNLEQLRNRDATTGDPLPGTDLDQIAQFYANLAYWLAPSDLRRDIKEEVRREMFFRAATHIDVLETVGNGTYHLGRVAKSVLDFEVGTADLYRIVWAAGGRAEQGFTGQLLDYALVGGGTPDAFGVQSQEVVLGSVVEVYHQFFKAQGLNPLNLREDLTPPALAFAGLENVFRAQLSRAEGLLSQLTDAHSGGPSGNN